MGSTVSAVESVQKRADAIQLNLKYQSLFDRSTLLECLKKDKPLDCRFVLNMFFEKYEEIINGA